MSYTVAALYRFTPIADASALRLALKQKFAPLDLCGTLLVAPEGINGTLAGSAASIDAMLEILLAHTGLSRAEVKFSAAPEKPFNRLKIRQKREIVTFKQPQADPATLVGTYVEAQDWDALINDEEVLLLDTRNTYETRIGMFKGAVDPAITSFTDFARFVRTQLDPNKHRKVAMYCTGGIRCEKASAFMRAEGFAEVYHLKGGILKYLETVPETDSSWQGDCYVFDKRMAVGHHLRTGHYAMCYYCGNALNENERADPHYEIGVSCHFCFSKTSEETKSRLRARHVHMRGKETSPNHLLQNP